MSINKILPLFVPIVILLSLLNLPQEIIDFIIKLFESTLISAVFSVFAGYIVELFSGDLLKDIFLVIEIRGIKISLTMFFIATILLKIFLFR
ncbi:MAG: hypothetical protein HY361_04575 [Candidatus Aenigmarchaeota archaeon]|nr:hypothetical protein [Candidatus Aenigmarchaeota archaeon]